MTYLIKVNDRLYGYNDPRILELDILTKGKKGHKYELFKRQTDIRVQYIPITTGELADDSRAYEETILQGQIIPLRSQA